MTPRRRSSQRQRILDLIARSHEHPTAAWVFRMLKKEMPSLSLGNVYRNIGILVEEGKLACRDFGDGVEHFDAITDQHYHFVCEQCGKAFDMALPLQDRLMGLAQGKTRHEIKSHTIHFYGVCENCQKIKNKGGNK